MIKTLKDLKEDQTMIRSNSRKVKARIETYIVEGFEDWQQDNEHLSDNRYSDICAFILKTMVKEKGLYPIYTGGTYQEVFIEWCQGLPSILNCDYYYNISAVDLLGEWLEESEEEKSKYDECQAETMITKLLYRELVGNSRFNISDIFADYVAGRLKED